MNWRYHMETVSCYQCHHFLLLLGETILLSIMSASISLTDFFSFQNMVISSKRRQRVCCNVSLVPFLRTPRSRVPCWLTWLFMSYWFLQLLIEIFILRVFSWRWSWVLAVLLSSSEGLDTELVENLVQMWTRAYLWWSWSELPIPFMPSQWCLQVLVYL